MFNCAINIQRTRKKIQFIWFHHSLMDMNDVIVECWGICFQDSIPWQFLVFLRD